MDWMNPYELDAHFSDPDFRSSFADLYALRALYVYSILAPTYSPPDAISGVVSLTEPGEELEARLRFESPSLSAAELRAALFGVFAHRELFVDVATTDKQKLATLIGSEIGRGAIRYPFIFGRELYDRFFDRYGTRRSDLQPEETQSFLGGR